MRCLPVLIADPAQGWGELVSVRLTGAAIRQICEHSVSGLPYEVDERVPREFCQPGNTFLQHAGLEVVFDLAQPPGCRVASLLCGGKPIDQDRRYSVVTTGFLARGYSGFHWFREGVDRETIGREEQIVIEALQAGVLFPPVDGRLRFLSGDSLATCTG